MWSINVKFLGVTNGFELFMLCVHVTNQSVRYSTRVKLSRELVGDDDDDFLLCIYVNLQFITRLFSGLSSSLFLLFSFSTRLDNFFTASIFCCMRSLHAYKKRQVRLFLFCCAWACQFGNQQFLVFLRL